MWLSAIILWDQSYPTDNILFRNVFLFKLLFTELLTDCLYYATKPSNILILSSYKHNTTTKIDIVTLTALPPSPRTVPKFCLVS